MYSDKPCPDDACADTSQEVQEVPPCPLYVRLSGVKVLVVGGGHVAAHKAELFLSYGAKVSVIAPQACTAIKAAAQKELLEWDKRPFCEKDCANARLIICATDTPDVQKQVYAEACRLGIPVNVVDVPALCTFIMPSIVRRGQLQIAISTNGASPTVARDIRIELEKRYDRTWDTYISLLGELRTLIKQRVRNPPNKGAVTDDCVAYSSLANSDDAIHTRARINAALAHSNLAERIAAGETLDAKQVYRELVEPLLDQDLPTPKS